MIISDKVFELFNNMVFYADNIFNHLHELSELEKAGKKSERAYFNIFNHLKELLEKENKLYRDNIDLILANRGDLFILAIENETAKNSFDLLIEFDPHSVYARIRSKMKYQIGLKKVYGEDIFANLRVNPAFRKPIFESFLDESILNDLQRMALFYVDNSSIDENHKIDYKYLVAFIYGLDGELADSYFEISKKELYLNSSLVYALNGFHEEIYRRDLTKILVSKFSDFVSYIILEPDFIDDNRESKIEIALNYLKAILDLLPLDIKEEFYNEFVMNFGDDENIPVNIKRQVINAMIEAEKGRKILRKINVIKNS